jgi:IMP cyclohydrolase
MKNPNEPYPGRQLFLGLTANQKPAFAYLVTGRSPQSRQRKATPLENSIIMGPIGNEPYDWLRHYTAIKYDKGTGLVVVSNGIQTEAIFETYKLLFYAGSAPTKGYLKKIMDGARSEPDSLNTPRIAGVITSPGSKPAPAYIIGIKTYGRPADTFRIEARPGILTGVATYSGDLASPAAFDVSGGLPEVKLSAGTPEELAEFIYNISAATYQGEDIRVCTVGGVLSGDNHTWNLAIINRHQD